MRIDQLLIFQEPQGFNSLFPTAEVFDRIHLLIDEAARNAFQEAALSVHGKLIFGFALYSDLSGATIGHLLGISDPRKDVPTEIRFNCFEWDVQAGLSYFAPVQAVLSDCVNALSPGEEGAFSERVFNSCVVVLKALRAERFFETLPGVATDFFLVFDVADYQEDEILRWVRALNPLSVVAEFEKWISRESEIVTTSSRLESPQSQAFTSEEVEFICLAVRGKEEQLAHLLNTSQFTQFVRDEALVLAARGGKHRVCALLIDNGANPFHVGYANKDAFTMAVEEGRKRVMPVLQQVAHQEPSRCPERLRATYDRAIFDILTRVIPAQRSGR